VSDLADKLRKALRKELGDRESVTEVTLSREEERHWKMAVGRAVLDATLVKKARDDPRAAEKMLGLVLLDLDKGFSPAQISKKTGGKLPQRIIREIIEGHRREAASHRRRLSKLARLGLPFELTPIKGAILTAAVRLGARNRASARPIAAICAEAGYPNVDDRNVREAIEELRSRGYLDARKGRTGGTWITPKGVAALSR
jgi:hypothetical protein